jgi:hypothetical protein
MALVGAVFSALRGTRYLHDLHGKKA